MTVFYSKLPVTVLLVVCALFSGCDSSSKTPSEEALVSALESLSSKHAEAFKITNIKKLDGQLNSDNLRYVMDYQATIETHMCFDLYYDQMKQVDFSRPIDTGPHVQRTCGRQGKDIAGYLSLGVGGNLTFKKGLIKQFQSKAVFIKKESGWQLLSHGLNAYTFD